MLALFLHYGANAVMSLNSKPMQFMHFFVSFRNFSFLYTLIIWTMISTQLKVTYKDGTNMMGNGTYCLH